MTDHTTADTGMSNAPLVVHGQYIKDLSFEAPHVPGIFQELHASPTVSIHVDVDNHELETNMFEVTLSFHIKSVLEDKVAFIIELIYATIVSLNVPREHVQPLVMIEVPRLLFPFARSIVADVSRDSGFPPLVMAPIDFVSRYRQQLEERQHVAA
ncbi:Protein export cytoplasm chaperone protein (SecB, maintains protein to be exported in unfolded state) [invertebrate metagenome]|uniref:Protein export cytoplasm chaperone protein (SecB, maintains protein to be exported in unfolded state) n=1 Tax=invertebrate metagenome TaxID=1711999 RepID=A0A484H760_9ZZZZ